MTCSSKPCPKADAQSITGGHRMRFEKALGERELWRCALCGLNQIVTRETRCAGCGGFKEEGAPWWCTRKDAHK